MIMIVNISTRVNINKFQQFHQFNYRNNVRKEPNFPSLSRFCLAAAANGRINDKKSVIQLPEDLRPELMPKHIAVITDGNGRWAKNRGLSVKEGHKAGSEIIKQMILNCSKYGIKVLTVFAFSTENWNRSKVEIDSVMSLIEGLIQSFIKELIKRENLRFSVIGDKSRLPQSLRDAISSAEESSEANKGLHFVMAIGYSGQYDITEATKKIAAKVENGIIRAKDINQSLFEQELTTHLIEYPNPDLLIRTSGELRISNFLLWQLAYAEFYFSDKMFPNFQDVDLIEALRSFQGRKRRFGGRKN